MGDDTSSVLKGGARERFCFVACVAVVDFIKIGPGLQFHFGPPTRTDERTTRDMCCVYQKEKKKPKSEKNVRKNFILYGQQLCI